MCTNPRTDSVRFVLGIQGKLAQKKQPVGLYGSPVPNTYGDPRGVGVSYERGTPVIDRQFDLGCGLSSRGRTRLETRAQAQNRMMRLET